MSLRLLIEMNLSVEWVNVLNVAGHDAVHWSAIGDIRAYDAVLMAYAREADRIVFTHDLDFGTALALTHASGPSVIQYRGQQTLPSQCASLILQALTRHEAVLRLGALIVVEEKRSRVRVLPI